MKEHGEEEDDDDHAIGLFDFYWFHHQILRNQSPPPPPPPPPACNLDHPKPEPCNPDPPQDVRPQPLIPKRCHRRSLSEKLALNPAAPCIDPPKLETILSGEEASIREAIARSEPGIERRGIARRRKKKGISKSMSDLEFEELRGFMDLGFTFGAGAEEDRRLMLIVPGLQRLGKREGASGDNEESTVVSRPYLSEAWEDEDPLRKWRIPADGEVVDMEGHLRFWAHAVASAVR